MSASLPPELAALLEQLADLVATRVAAAQQAAGEQASARALWLNAESAARYLDWPRQRLYKLTARGEIPHYKHEGRLVFRRDELDEWMRGYAQPVREQSG